MGFRWKLIFYIIFVGWLTGCSIAASPSELIKSPQAQKEEEIQLTKKLEKLLPPDAELMTPEQSSPNQSIYMEDINKDGDLEAFILYRSLGEDRQVHMLALQQEKKGWKEITDIETGFLSLDYFGLHDLGDSEGVEVIIGLGTSEFESEKQLDIYEWDSNSLRKKGEQGYDVVDIADYDGDNRPDLLLVHGIRRESYTAELYHYKNGKLASQSSVSLEPYAFHENIVSGKLADGTQALFIDSAIGAHSMITEMIAYADGTLVKIDEELIKAYPLYSKDMDEDGVIEVGGMYIPKGWEHEPFAEIPFIEYYSTYSMEGAPVKEEERYTNMENRFYVSLPSEWNGKVTVKKVKNGIQLQSIANGELLFEVKWAKKSTVDSVKHLLRETKDMIFYSTMNENQKFPFEQFHLLDEES